MAFIGSGLGFRALWVEDCGLRFWESGIREKSLGFKVWKLGSGAQVRGEGFVALRLYFNMCSHMFWD